MISGCSDYGLPVISDAAVFSADQSLGPLTLCDHVVEFQSCDVLDQKECVKW